MLMQTKNGVKVVKIGFWKSGVEILDENGGETLKIKEEGEERQLVAGKGKENGGKKKNPKGL